jgi:GntP family gluconate:H+ symporter
MIAAYFFALYIGKRVKAKDEPTDDDSTKQTYEQLVASYGKLPSGFASFAPIIVPIILMGLSSALSMAGKSVPFITFLGTPIIALTVGVLFGVLLLAQSGKMKDFYELTNETLKTVGPILFVTAAGGVLGKVISSSNLIDFIKNNASVLRTLGYLFPFFLAAILKTAQGSSTVAITTSAGIIAPIMQSIGFVTPVSAALVVVAIGAGAMTVSHANDSYFWVVTNFGEMDTSQGYKTQTLGTLIIGVASLIEVLILSLFLK